MTSQRVGSLNLKKEIQPGTTISDLLDRLYDEDHEDWQRLYDKKKKKMRPPIYTFLNGKSLSPSVLFKTVLADGDQLKFIVAYAGG